jgi:hypothetical protein
MVCPVQGTSASRRLTMSSQDHSGWPEHAVCARCAAPLGENYKVSPLGLRFCKDCFDTTVQEKARERAAKIYLQERCSNCGNSLINGYRLSPLGVLYCTSCYNNLMKTPEEKTDGPSTADSEAEQAGWRGSIGVSEGILWAELALSHLLFFINSLFPANYNWRLPHPDSFFKGLVCLDLLTFLLLLVSNRLPASRLRLLWTLLIASGFIILMGREIIGIVSR